MAKNNRIFVSFAIEDLFYKNGLVNQAKDERSPFEFTDMAVKEPWEDSLKTRCRSRIKSCDGVIALVGPNTKDASGARWEINCAAEERVPMIGVHIHKDLTRRYTPPELIGHKVVDWSWQSIASFIKAL